MRRFIRPLIVVAALAATVPTGVLSASAATTHPAATRPATASAALVRKLNRLVAEHQAIRIPLSKLRHGTIYLPASRLRAARRAGAGPVRQPRGARAAAAAASCQNIGCFNLDPVSQSNCSAGGYPVSGFTQTYSGLGTLRLMYQNSCEANWAEADNASTSAWITVYSIVGNTYYQILPYNLAPYNYGWTSMVPGYNVNAAACIGFAGQTPHCMVQKSTSAPALPSEPFVWVS
jgi:hypothetical protein